MCQKSAEKLLLDFQPQLLIAIGGGGYVPARILRSFLKKGGAPNIPIQAIGLSLYESLGNDEVEAPGTKVTRTQWLDLTALGEMQNLVGKRILIVDEVDDTRTTLEYAVRELEKDVETARQKMGGTAPKTEFSIFVLHVCNTATKLQVIANLFVEQGQAQEGKAPRRDARHPLLRCRDRRRCLDQLPLGGHRYRRA